jgi:hypothetical protein
VLKFKEGEVDMNFCVRCFLIFGVLCVPPKALAERAASLTWLWEPESPHWQVKHHHPKMGPLSAELLLVNWLAHDLFHIRQINDLHFAYLCRQAAPISLAYSGWEQG